MKTRDVTVDSNLRIMVIIVWRSITRPLMACSAERRRIVTAMVTPEDATLASPPSFSGQANDAVC